MVLHLICISGVDLIGQGGIDVNLCLLDIEENPMKKEEALRLFGSASNLARVLGITRQAVSRWADDVPLLRAYQIRDVLAARKDQKEKTE